MKAQKKNFILPKNNKPTKDAVVYRGFISLLLIKTNFSLLAIRRFSVSDMPFLC